MPLRDATFVQMTRLLQVTSNRHLSEEVQATEQHAMRDRFRLHFAALECDAKELTELWKLIMEAYPRKNIVVGKN